MTPLIPSNAPPRLDSILKDTVTTDTPETGVPADTDAGATARRNPDTEHDSRTVEVSVAHDDPSATTTEHLRQLWMAGARDITVTYNADAVRHRTYLSHPRTDI